MNMKKPTNLLPLSAMTSEQQRTVDRLYDYDHTLLIAKMGAGKTVCTLTAIKELFTENVLDRVLVIAPLKVCDNVWAYEHLKWVHLEHLTVAVATGDVNKRRAAVECESQVLVLNLENVAWFFDQYRDDHRCNGLIVDELSKFKNVGGVGFKKLRRRLHVFTWRCGMTGTPVSEDWTGLYGQMMVVDGGERLGTNQQSFLDRFFYPTDYSRRNWVPRAGCDRELVEAIRGIVYTMPDYRAELPPITYVTETVTMSQSATDIYRTLKKDMLVKIDAGQIVASNEAVLTGKLAQAASGFLYDTESEAVEVIHHAKLDRVHEIIASYDSPVLLAYWFNYDRDILQASLDCPIYGGSKSKAKTKALEDEWNTGRHKVMMIHPRSGGHGLNIQEGGCVVVWYGPQWSRDLWEQLNARLWRKGQKKPVTVVVIETEGTIDQLISARVEGKGAFDKALHTHLAS